MNAVRGAEAKRPCRRRVVEDEDRHDAVELAGREGQGGVVGDAEVAAKPEQRGGGHGSEIRG